MWAPLIVCGYCFVSELAILLIKYKAIDTSKKQILENQRNVSPNNLLMAK